MSFPSLGQSSDDPTGDLLWANGPYGSPSLSLQAELRVLADP
jgi:hypothetical protein